MRSHPDRWLSLGADMKEACSKSGRLYFMSVPSGISRINHVRSVDFLILKDRVSPEVRGRYGVSILTYQGVGLITDE